MSQQLSINDLKDFTLTDVLAADSSVSKRLEVTVNLSTGFICYHILQHGKIIGGGIHLDKSIELYNGL